MDKLKPCPFCGSIEENYTVTFKRDKRKVFGIYYQICKIQCDKCTCTISQAGHTNELAEKNAIAMWNRRAGEDG